MHEILIENYNFKPPSKYDVMYRFENENYHYRIHLNKNWLRKLSIKYIDGTKTRYFERVEDLYYKSQKELIEYLQKELLKK